MPHKNKKEDLRRECLSEGVFSKKNTVSDEFSVDDGLFRMKTYQENVKSFCNSNTTGIITYCTEYKKEYVDFLRGGCPETCYFVKTKDKSDKLKQK